MSLSKYKWVVSDPNDDYSKPLIHRILELRNITEEDEVELFLNPNYEQHLHDPLLMADMKKAVEFTLNAIKENKKIIVFGDYDADGVTATALLYSFLKEVNANCDYFLPHRLKDGYGITPEGVRLAKERGAELIITVDNGIVANDAIDEANSLDLPVIITDHHKQGGELPNAYAVVNPNRDDCPYPFKGISGVGVAFKFVQLLSKELQNAADREKFLRWNLDLVALGTVADVMPLLDENRVLVHYGLKVLSKTRREGLKAILLGSKRDNSSADTFTIGFQIGPKINAAGRLEAADRALELLLTTDEDEATQLANELDEINKRRQELTEKAVTEAAEKITGDEKIIILESTDWHQGIIGLIAARICERFSRPTLIFSIDEEKNIYKASGRSPAFFDITKAIMNTPELVINGGGHVQACGCSIAGENYEKFKHTLLEYCENSIETEDLTPELYIDTHLLPEQINLSTFDDLSKLAPFGQAFPEPVFVTKNVAISRFRQVGFNGKHLQISLEKSRKIYKGIAFNMGHLANEISIGRRIDVAYTLSKNAWNGSESVQLMIKDIN